LSYSRIAAAFIHCPNCPFIRKCKGQHRH